MANESKLTIKSDSTGYYITVVSGNTLSEIAAYFKGKTVGGSTFNKTYKQIANINNISNPNLIYIGQKIYLVKDGGSGGGGSTTTTAAKDPNITQFGQSTTDKKLFATWTWSKYKETAKYKVLWRYTTGNNVWIGTPSDKNVDKDAPETALYDEFSIPDNATSIKFKIKPIAETEKQTSGNTSSDVEKWTQGWSEEKTWNKDEDMRPSTPTSAPSPEIDNYTLTVTLKDLDDVIDSVDFQIVKDNKTVVHTKEKVAVNTGYASYQYTLTAGSVYKVRYRVRNGNLVSDWSPYSDNKATAPAAPKEIIEIRAYSENEIYLKWTAVNPANTPEDNKITYDIEYTTNKEYFDTSKQVTSETGWEQTEFITGDLDTGKEYFFRVRAGNDAGKSAWTPIKSVVIGTTPEPPTTWSSVTTTTVGEDVNLYWVHNSEDSSHQTFAELELYVYHTETKYDKYSFTLSDSDKTFPEGVTDDKILIDYTALSKDDLEAGKTHSCLLKTATFAEGVSVKWRVKTAGVTKTFGDWSIQRTIDIHAVPTLELTITDADAENANVINTVTAFPFYIKGIAGPLTQTPIGYQLSITSNSLYETTDNVGNEIVVNKGEAVYSKHFDTFQTLLVEFTPGNITLENNIGYTVTCVVSMDSGLTATSTADFTVSWEGMRYSPTAAVGIDTNDYTASIRPYCEDRNMVYHKVNKNGRVYEVDPNTTYEFLSGEAVIENKVYSKTTTGEQVYSGTTDDGEDVYFCTVVEIAPVDNVIMSVYRREFDGSFTELATNIDGANRTTITDPHPALDLARYRIVAKDKDTGTVGYTDLPGIVVGGKAIVIQWAEEWTSYEVTEDGFVTQPPWTGSLLKLPYNVDVTENNDPEVETIEYIGRENPVAYYGTQHRETATWNAEVDKTDKETVYALRRLSKWMGDVYVREPSGVGYWAHVTVSFSQTHLNLTIPVTLTITRVEGGA